MRKDILSKIVASDYFSLHQLSEFLVRIFEKDIDDGTLGSPLQDGQLSESAQQIARILAVGLNKELIWSKATTESLSVTDPRDALRAAKGGIQLTFEFGSVSRATSIINTAGADSESKQEAAGPLEENPILKKILTALASSVKQ